MPNLRSNILNSLAFTTLVLTGSLMFQSAHAADTSSQAQLQHWSTQAGAAGSSESGKIFFNQKHGKEWSCASCHGAAPVNTGTHANTGKSIPPLTPAANDKAFTDTAKINKWFRRNCKDVLSRECTAAEKADVIAYLISLKP